MPGFNQTGPMGQGPMTGRRMGRCTNFGANQSRTPNTDKNYPQDAFPGRGFGFGRGQGGRGGRGRRFGMQNRFRGGF
ncbi:MAG: DUF5320 domain-containing protein [Bacteroidales bacterium]|nr:DUF5320 domain-containing protein [Bacteroidales bacterium]